MNFFDQDFGLSSSPTYPRRPPTAPQKAKPAFDQVSRKSGKKDQFDDLLDDLLNKQEKKKEKKKEREIIQPFSSTNLDPYPIQDFKKTQKWSTPNIDLHPSYHHQSPRFPNSRLNSVMDEKGSEDGRSYKSGITRQPQQQIDQLMTLRQPDQFKEETPALQRSSRNMMRPPLAKKQSKQQFTRQPKETSIVPDDTSVKYSRGGFQSQTNIQFTPYIENRSRNKESKGVTPEQKIKERVIQKEKIITVREEAVQLKKQFQNELKQIKESYQRQLKFVNDKLKQQIDDNKKQKAKIIIEYETKIDDERNRLQKINQQGINKLKELHQWELKKRCEAYQNQIEKVKSISKLQDTLSRQQNNYQVTQESMQNKIKEKQLGLEKRKVEQLKMHLDQRQKDLQFQQQNFQNYRKREEQKIQNDRRLLLQKQNELKKIQLQNKRNLALHKQQMANELANAELELYRKRQSLNLQKEQVRMERELALKQKQQFESFNKDVFNDYKNKIKELQLQKQKCGQLQVQLHKKIQTVQLNIDMNRPSRQSITKGSRPVSSHQENRKNFVNSEIDNKVTNTKERFKEMEELARKLNVQTFEERQRMKQKVNVSAYITRLNRAITRH